jgi:hypothetical protein
MITVALLSLNMASNEIRNQAFNQLEAVREIKASAIKRYFSTVESQLVTMANTPSVIQAMNSFPEAFANALSEENLSDGQLGQYKEELRSYYGSEFAAKYTKDNGGETVDHEELVNSLDAQATPIHL